MNPLTAAVILAWVAIVVLAFAMAGILHQLRGLQTVILRQSSDSHEAIRASRQFPSTLLPRQGKLRSAILLGNSACGVCREVSPVFEALAGQHEENPVDYIILTYDDQYMGEFENARLIVDAASYHSLNPGWIPALVVANSAGEVLFVEPVGSKEAITKVALSVNSAACE
jgi:hypothetical protein